MEGTLAHSWCPPSQPPRASWYESETREDGAADRHNKDLSLHQERGDREGSAGRQGLDSGWILTILSDATTTLRIFIKCDNESIFPSAWTRNHLVWAQKKDKGIVQCFLLFWRCSTRWSHRKEEVFGENFSLGCPSISNSQGITSYWSVLYKLFSKLYYAFKVKFNSQSSCVSWYTSQKYYWTMDALWWSRDTDTVEIRKCDLLMDQLTGICSRNACKYLKSYFQGSPYQPDDWRWVPWLWWK